VFNTISQSAADLMTRGGPVMWPLLALSLISATLIFERCWYFLRANSPGRMSRVRAMAKHLRRGDRAAAKAVADADRSL
jgi:biopolymer transport protein ExbB